MLSLTHHLPPPRESFGPRRCVTDVGRIDSQSDSQTGGDHFPPSEGSSSDSPAAQRQQQEQQHRQQQQQARPVNLSLNISALPPALPSFSAGMSPASLVSTSAPFTDATSLSLVGDPSDDYFRFAEASIASATNSNDQAASVGVPFTSPMNGTQHQQQQQQQPQSATQPRIDTNMNQTPPAPLTAPSAYGTFPGSYRVPASQPTSPVRMMPSAQQLRQRSATTSMAGDNGAPQFPNGVSNGVSAVPTHLSFTAIHGGSGTASPVVSTTPGGGDHGASQVAVALGDVTMEDASQATPSRPSHSRHPSTNMLPSAANPNMAQQMSSAVPTGNDIAERLTMERLTMLDT